MNFLTIFLRGIALLPSMVQGVEEIYGAKTGQQKRDAALDAVSASLRVPDASRAKRSPMQTGFQAAWAWWSMA